MDSGDIALLIIGVGAAIIILLLITRNREGGWGPSH